MALSTTARSELGSQPSMPLRQADLTYIRFQNSPSEAVRISEYLNASGVVFALTWYGPGQPDLERLLGVYYKKFLVLSVQAASARTGVQYQSSDLWIETGGHMRSSYGRIVLPQLCPATCDFSVLNP